MIQIGSSCHILDGNSNNFSKHKADIFVDIHTNYTASIRRINYSKITICWWYDMPNIPYLDPSKWPQRGQITFLGRCWKWGSWSSDRSTIFMMIWYDMYSWNVRNYIPLPNPHLLILWRYSILELSCDGIIANLSGQFYPAAAARKSERTCPAKLQAQRLPRM